MLLPTHRRIDLVLVLGTTLVIATCGGSDAEQQPASSQPPDIFTDLSDDNEDEDEEPNDEIDETDEPVDDNGDDDGADDPYVAPPQDDADAGLLLPRTTACGDGANSVNIVRVVLGFFVSTVVGAVVLYILIDLLAWPYITKNLSDTKRKPERTLTIPLGLLERASYTTAILLGVPTWIGVWLALKVAAQWHRWTGDERATYNVFLIGNILSLFFGLLGAWIALGRMPDLRGQ